MNVWYNIIRKEREVLTMINQFTCIVYLADGKHISQIENCDTASEAIERAAKWRALGHKAQAYRMEYHLDPFEVCRFSLD